MSEPQEKYLICMPWDMRAAANNIPVVKLLCSKCDREVVVDAKNAVRCTLEGVKLVCLPCVAEVGVFKGQGAYLGGGMVGGQQFTDPMDAIKAVDELVRQSRKDTKDN